MTTATATPAATTNSAAAAPAAAASTPAPAPAAPAAAANATPAAPNPAEGQAAAAPAATATPAKEPEKGAEAAQPAAKVVPEKYEVTLPEGHSFSPAQLDAIADFAKKQGFSNEQAQALVETQHAAIKSYAESEATRLKTHNEQNWKSELQSDPAIGGQNFEANGLKAAQAAEWAFGEGFANELKAMNLNHHPKLFRGLVKIANALANDKLVSAPPSQGKTKSAAEKIYGEPQPKE